MGHAGAVPAGAPDPRRRMAAKTQMGCSVKTMCRRRFRLRLLPVALLAASPAHATTYFLTVAGLGGEPDYEQRFALLATDTDKLLRAGGGTDRVIETLKGADATKAKMT